MASEATIVNWITKYDLVCLPKSEMGMCGGLMLAGYFFGSIFLVRLGDIVGRKMVTVVSSLAGVVALIGIIAAQNIIALFLFIFIYGLAIAPRSFMAYVWALELSPKAWEHFYST